MFDSPMWSAPEEIGVWEPNYRETEPCSDRLAQEAECRLRNAGVPGAELLAVLQAGENRSSGPPWS